MQRAVVIVVEIIFGRRGLHEEISVTEDKRQRRVTEGSQKGHRRVTEGSQKGHRRVT
jgi:hypothetical protein